MTDPEIINGILAGGRKMEQVFHFILSDKDWRNAIFLWLKGQGTKEDIIEDVFQDGVKYLIINIRNGAFKGQSSLKTYLSSICRNCWMNYVRKTEKEISLNTPMEESVDDHHTFIDADSAHLLQKIMGVISTKCKEILGWWALGFSAKEIADKAGYKSEMMARKKKSECMKALTEYLLARPGLVKQLTE